MDNQNLISLITAKGFDTYKDELATKYETEGMDFQYEYTNNGDMLTVWINFGNIPTIIQINTNGLMAFTYFKGGIKTQQHFINCTCKDFLTMLNHAFFYLRDRNFDHHKEWYNKLEKPAI